jgi:hypothetical protein
MTRYRHLSNTTLTDEFSAAWTGWRGDELGEARLNMLHDEIVRRERQGQLTDEDWLTRKTTSLKNF